MHVVQLNDTTLQLEHFPVPWVIGLGAVQLVLLFALIKSLVDGAPGGVAISLVMLLVIGWLWLTKVYRRLRVVLDRERNALRISTTTLLGEHAAEYPLAELTGAEVETRHGANSIPETRLVLLLGNAEPPRRLCPDPFKPDTVELLNASERINAWLASAATPQPAPGTASGDVRP